MTRTTKQIEIAHPLSADPQHLPRLPASTSLSKPQRPKSKSLQPCRCSHEGCGKMFSKRSNLKAHMRVHSGVLPYPCHFPGCTKRFRWKSSLKPHIRVHLATGHASNPTCSSNTATSTELLTTTTRTLNHTEIAQPRAASALKPVLTEQLLEMHSKGLIFDRRDQPIDQSPTAINAPDDLGISYEMEQRQEVRRRTDNGPVYPLNKPAVARVLFQDSHEHSDTHYQGEIDLSTESVLSSSATSYETDVVSFSFDSPMEDSHESTTDNTLTEHLWKSDIQVMDPFEGLSMDGGESNIEFLSGFDRNSGISATSLEGNLTDSQWMFSSAGSTVSSAEFTTTLNSLSI